MSTSIAILSSQRQITVPAAVCKIMKLKPSMKILFVEHRPGEFQLVPGPKTVSKKDWVKNLYGKYQQPGIDGVQSLLDDKKEELILEERKYL